MFGRLRSVSRGERVNVSRTVPSSARPKFQGSPTGISIQINDLCQTRVPVSGYILINRSASACSSSASVTW